MRRLPSHATWREVAARDRVSAARFLNKQLILGLKETLA